MIKYVENKFALSEQGAKDLVKASIYCTLTNLVLMFPIGIIYMFLQEVIKPIIGGGVANVNMWTYIAMSLVILVILFIFEYIQYNSTYIASYTESSTKRISLAEKLRKLPLSFFGKKDLSDLTTTIMADCASLETAFSHYIPEIIGAVLSVIIASIGLFVMNFKMAIALLWVVPIAFIIVFLGKRKQDKLNILNKKMQLDNADGIQECIETVREIKANNKSETYIRRLDEKLKKSEKIQVKAELNTAMFVISAQMILKVGIATVVLVGGMILLNGEIDLLTFLMFLIAACRIFDPLSSALINLAAIFYTLIQIKRMKDIEDEEVQTGKENPVYNSYDICFENVGFSYNDNETVLDNVSFTAKQGEITALVGPSGGGKSTVAKLAARFWDINKGKITLGGNDISNIDPEALLENYSIVFQNVVLFNNTIMENIRIGKKNATDDEVIMAAKAARCEEFILKMPLGYNTIIGENGSTLSGGERQRLSIARALLKDAPVILLDEATASLDVENETKIQEAISELVSEKTVIVIAHRMRTISGADKIVVLNNGTISGMGPSEELMKNNRIYANMVKLQNKSNEWKIS